MLLESIEVECSCGDETEVFVIKQSEQDTFEGVESEIRSLPPSCLVWAENLLPFSLPGMHDAVADCRDRVRPVYDLSACNKHRLQLAHWGRNVIPYGILI